MTAGTDAFRTIAARDGARIRVGLREAATPRALCLVLTGQSEWIEKYDEVADALIARGFSVAVMDWRGQGRSGARLKDTRKVHVRDFSDYDLDLEALLKQVAEPWRARHGRPVIALGHSMGGHLLARGLHDHAGDFACAILSAPMIGIPARGYPPWFVRATATIMGLADGEGYVWGVDNRDPLTDAFHENPVTSDEKRFQRSRDFLAAHPEIRLVGPTWRWLAAAYRSMARLKRASWRARVTMPVLVVGAGRDAICVTPEARDFARGLPDGAYIEIPEARHEILMECDPIRARFWAAFDNFVSRVL